MRTKSASYKVVSVGGAQNVAAAFAAALRAAGVERVYGLPGEDHLRLLDALPAAGLTYIGARDETSAVLMAATEARARGVPGIALVTIAPGITNAINGLAHAWLDGVPLLIVSGQHAPERAPLIVRQGLDAHRLVQPLTKWTATASARIHQVAAKAFDIALAAPTGPVYLELRDDVAALPPLDRLRDWPVLQSATRTYSSRASIVDDLPVGLNLLSSARRPTLVVGAQCPTDDATREAIDHASRGFGAPIFTSPAAMGIASTAHPFFAGTFMNGNLESELLGASDLILALGLDATDFFNVAWRYAAPVLAINERADTQRFAPVQHQLIGHTALLLDALVANCARSDWTVSDVNHYRARVESPFHLEDDAFTIPSALRAARRVLPADTLVAVDAGFGKPLASYLWSSCEPNSYFTAHGLSTMGYAIPAVNALKLAYPRRNIVAFMGDGSLLMRASEMTVAVEHGVAPIYIAWMDAALAQIHTKQLRQHLRPVGASVPRVDCGQLAAAYGATGLEVGTLAEFEDALCAALESQLPTLIGAAVDQSHRAEWYELLRG